MEVSWKMRSGGCGTLLLWNGLEEQKVVKACREVNMLEMMRGCG